MEVSAARIAANQRNSKRSKGPVTVEGKRASRANSLKHGLCSSVVVPEDLQQVKIRSYQWHYTLKPQNECHAWLVDQVAIYSLRIDRLERMERRFRDRHALRAELNWDDDRLLEAEKLGSLIRRDPSAVVRELRQSPQGCQWLMGRWAMLAHIADLNQSWTADQSQLAFDLLGTPLVMREGVKPGALLDPDGRMLASADDLAAVARRQIAALRERQAEVSDLDEVDRCLTEADLTDAESNRELKLLRRYESALFGRLKWCLSQLKYESPHLRPHPDLSYHWYKDAPTPTMPGPEPEPEPAAEPEPAPAAESKAAEPEARKPLERWRLPDFAPPFDLEPHEFPPLGEKADIPAIVAARAEAKRKKAESRREASRRKLERLRA